MTMDPNAPESRPAAPAVTAVTLENVAETETVHHRTAASKAQRPRGVAQLNLVSMMDVCFQLLIFFVLTASFAIGEGILPAELPSGQGAKPRDDAPPQQPITIMLRSLGGSDIAIEVQGGGTVENFEALYRLLAGLQRNASNPNGIYLPDDPVIIQPEGTVGWGAVVNTFNQAVRAKFLNVNFAQPQKN